MLAQENDFNFYNQEKNQMTEETEIFSMEKELFAFYKEQKGNKNNWDFVGFLGSIFTCFLLIFIVVSIWNNSFKPILYTLGIGGSIMIVSLFFVIKEQVKFDDKWIGYIEKNDKNIVNFTKSLVYNSKSLEVYENLAKNFLKKEYSITQLDNIYNLFIQHKEKKLDSEIEKMTVALKEKI
jgi:uncharacterized membrane protein YvlD (DUF360 family)